MKGLIAITFALLIAGCSDNTYLTGDLRELNKGVEFCKNNGGVHEFIIIPDSGIGQYSLAHGHMADKTDTVFVLCKNMGMFEYKIEQE